MNNIKKAVSDAIAYSSQEILPSNKCDIVI